MFFGQDVGLDGFLFPSKSIEGVEGRSFSF